MDKNNFLMEDNVLKSGKVFRDAIHNYISVDDQLILKLIDCKEMQRLRRIKQLGGTHQVYGSAEHSRFTHSLGVYHIARLMCKRSCIGEHLSDYDKLTVQCAALLHDVGHGPFSHCFESVFNTNHEQFTVGIITGETEIRDVLESFCSGFSLEVASVIAKTHTNKILISMVSSQLDCDRMDYLLRDSYFSGTTYGQFDLQRILRIMDVVGDEIVYKNSGIQAIEDYILARYHMYWQVYYHPTTRSYEQLLLCVFTRIKDLYNENFDLGDISYLQPFLDDTLNVKNYLDLDESVVLYYFKKFGESKDKTLADLSSRFLNRRLFKYCDDLSKEEIKTIEDKCILQGLEKKYYLVSDDQTQVPYNYTDSNIAIIKDHKIIPLHEVSEIVGAITHSKKSKKDHKYYYPQ